MHRLQSLSTTIASTQRSTARWSVRRYARVPIFPVNRNTVLFLPDPHSKKDIYLVGTAHVSRPSADEVREVIQKVNPDCIMVELCETRAAKIRKQLRTNPNTKQLSVLENTFPDFTPHGPFGQLLKGVYDVLRGLGFDPGLEMKVAMEEAAERRVPLILGDQDVKVTMNKLGKSFRPDQLIKMMFNPQMQQMGARMAMGMGAKPGGGKSALDASVIAELVEKLKDRQSARELVQCMEKMMPDYMRVLLHERDEYLANSLKKAQGTRVVGVVGLAHLDGIERSFLELKPVVPNFVMM